jgi:hypothetical protein
MRKRPTYHYHYWSKRQTLQLVEELGINSRPRWLFGASGGLSLFQLQVQQQDHSLRVDEVAARLEASGTLLQLQDIGSHVKTPYFLRGVADTMHFLISFESMKLEFGALAHAAVLGQNTSQADLCLFGSLKNFLGFQANNEPSGAGLATSSQFGFGQRLYHMAQLIEAFPDGATAIQPVNPPISELPTDSIRIPPVDGEHALSAVSWVRHGGPTTAAQNDQGKAWHYTSHYFDKVEWCAQIYVDKTIDAKQTKAKGLEGNGRILVGSPVWVRTKLPMAKSRRKSAR